jgi:methionine synthase I (cobalamin-dependent)
VLSDSLFQQEEPVVLDGAMGSLLVARSVASLADPHHACLHAPQAVSAVHAEYAQAGAKVATTNTFLLLKEDEATAFEILARAIELARPFGAVWVSLGPAARAPSKLPSWWPLLAQADAVLFETWSGPDLLPWMELARMAPTPPLILSFCFQPDKSLTTAGWEPNRLADMAHQFGASAVGVNCGWEGGSEASVRAVEAFRAQTRLPIVAKPASCGLGPAAWATMARRCVLAGARFVGGCCGTDPEYIRLFHGLS